MNNIPDTLKYTAEHEWIREEGNGVVCIGITDHAQSQLGDLVFVELPEMGAALDRGAECAVVESVKAASDVFSLSGDVLDTNEALEDTPELINQDPYGDGWIFKMSLGDPDELGELLDAAAYAELVAAETLQLFMPFIPHSEADLQAMLDVVGVASLEDLFREIPAELRCGELTAIPPGMGEAEIARLMQQRARSDGQPLCFIGAGAYEHHIPAAVWQLATRGEFYSAYTPYQAEASQGTLQLLYEYQSMMTALTGMEVSNASLYDGASALGEALLMAVRANHKSKSKRILIPRSLHPAYRQTAYSIVCHQGLELVEIPFVRKGGHTDPASLAAYAGQDFAALVINQPNFFGVLEEVDALTDWAHANKALAIAVVNPLALALLKPPGTWGQTGADICCGEGQPLGIPLASGGPYLGFLCTRQALVRQMPGRIVGATRDRDGQIGYTLTLQAREQHIRRSKATSNICTNQGLMVTAATIHMALLGNIGLERVAAACHANTRDLTERLCNIPGVTPIFERPVFHEQALHLPIPTSAGLRALAARGILGGYDLKRDYPELGDNAILVCATELRTADDLALYQTTLARIIAAQGAVTCLGRCIS